MPHSPPTASMAMAQRHTRAGILLFLAALVLFASYDAFAKHMLQWHSPEAMNLSRYVVILWMALGLLLANYGPQHAWRQVRRHAGNRTLWLRSISLAVVALSFMTALVEMPLAEATAIYFTAPLIMVLLATRLLGERIRGVQVAAVVLGFAGMLLMVRPGSHLPLLPSLLMLISAVSYALFQLLTRRLAGQVPFAVQFFFMACACLVLTLLPALVRQQLVLPPLHQWPLPLLGGFLSGAAQLLLLAAYRRVPAATLAPLNYLQLLMAVLISMAFSHRMPDVYALLGMTAIAAAGIALALCRPR